MTAGLTIFFDDGDFQIDSESRVSTLSFKKIISGGFVSNGGQFVGYKYYVDIQIPDDVSYMAFACSSEQGIALWARVGGTWRFKTATTSAFTIYGFADQEIKPTDYGLQLYSSSGVLTYDSGASILRVKSVTNISASPTTINLPADGRVYAAGVGSYPKRHVGAAWAGIPYWIEMSWSIYITPNYCRAGEAPIASRPTGGGGQPPPPPTPAMPPPSVMLIDVTGF